MILLSIGNLSNDTDEKEIARLFSSFGKIRSIKFTLGPPHSRFPGSGFVELEGNDAKRVIAALDGSLLRGMSLRISEVYCSNKVSSSTTTDAPADTTPPISFPKGHSAYQPFRLISVERVSDPLLGQAQDWFRYTLISGTSRITGLHRGTLAEVTEFAENSTEAFNLRNRVKGGRSTAWSSRNKK